MYSGLSCGVNQRPPAAFKLGGRGSYGTFPECSFGYKQPNLANQRPPSCVRLLLSAGVGQSATSIQGNLGIQGKRETGEKMRSR